MEFHISSQARKRYDFSDKLFTFNGNVIFADIRAVRVFTDRVNTVRRQAGEKEIYAGEVNALGLIDEIMHAVIEQYRRTSVPDLNERLYAVLEEQLGSENLEKVLTAFCEEFPPLAVLRGEQSVKEYLDGETQDGVKNRYDTVEEIILCWVTNRNPAAMKLAGEFFDETRLSQICDYNKVIFRSDEFLKTLPKINGLSLIDYLRKPALEHPDSLFDQLEFIRNNWADILGVYLTRLLLGIDLMKEEFREHGFGGPGPVEIPLYAAGEGGGEVENFSMDSEWMPRLVLIAKNAFVWLYQLSKKYGYEIAHLDQIPDEELKTLADAGFTGLWLIGLWERSAASKTIKQWCGNPEALASAYSLAGYTIANDLGGEEAFSNLKERARNYGIRLASDMVPNHMGIDSDWVLYHPDRFLSLPYCPYPSYGFNCGNLSPDPNIGIRIEDHYFTRSDAAVVFQRIDYRTGDVRYIYHGNDGTTMPWNDTAQLNYLNPEVREVVIQTIIDVAKHTPIIRFDAAMTLAKKHYQRLWFPEPGTGGDIATRAEHAMTKEEFDRAFPEEFWREVVDRVAVEAPDTLLLAEAFWLMESYFVRTLGMHRVYNSAFMNLLRDEDNARYRTLMKTTLEFDPDILQRWVNFMNNPDERTAVEQFGTGGKYFGICVLMSTLPGLPMFGHGQLEGYSEKYGMEYRRAYKDEGVNYDLLRRHEKEIFPLLHMRRRFSGAKNFVLYNFANNYGNVDENVYAYSNYGGGVHTLVVYNNRFGETDGTIRQSVNFVRKENGEKIPTSTTLGADLGLHYEDDYFLVLHDQIRGLTYVRYSKEILNDGLRLHLGAYQYFVFSEVYEVRDDASHSWRQLCEWLHGEGTPDIWEALEEIRFGSILRPYRGMTDGHKLVWLYNKFGQPIEPDTWAELRGGTWNDFSQLSMNALSEYGFPAKSQKELFNIYISGMTAMLKDPAAAALGTLGVNLSAEEKVSALVRKHPSLWIVLLIAQQERLLTVGTGERPNIHELWYLDKTLTRNLRTADLFEISIDDQVKLIRWLYDNLDAMRQWTAADLDTELDALLRREDTRSLLKTNLWDNVLWFNKESAEVLTDLIRICGPWVDAFDPDFSAARQLETTQIFDRAADLLAERIADSEYRFERLLDGSVKKEDEAE